MKVIEHRNRLCREIVEHPSLELYSKSTYMWSQATCSGGFYYLQWGWSGWTPEVCDSPSCSLEERGRVHGDWNLLVALVFAPTMYLFLTLFTDGLLIQSWCLYQPFSFWTVVFTVGSFTALSVSDGGRMRLGGWGGGGGEGGTEAGRENEEGRREKEKGRGRKRELE